MQTFFVHLLLLLTTIIPLTLSTSPNRFIKSSSASSSPLTISPSTSSSHKPQEYIEVTSPLPSDRLAPSCTQHIVRHSFANTINQPPFTTLYSPPSDCPSPWSHVTLEFHAKSKGEQYDRICGIWLGGAEILRTSTAEPTDQGIFWKVRKDVTRYHSLLVQENLDFTVMLENVVNDVYTGVYHVEVTLFFYKDEDNVRIPSIQSIPSGFVGRSVYYEWPADLIIPISSSDVDKGNWFIIQRELDFYFKKVRIPSNAHKVVLEVYVSFHGNDEFWYSNPSDSYLRANNLTDLRGNGAYREVFVTIDGKYVGSEVPSPVVFTGGINPLFWGPVVGIGAFNLPSYDFDLTPFLGLVLDGKDHTFGVGVTDSISYWLVDANIHVWLDLGSPSVIAKSVVHINPALEISRGEEFKLLDGLFEIKAERVTRLEGWVKSSFGNFTTSILQEFKYKNSIRFKKNGTYEHVNQLIRTKREVKVKSDEGGSLSHVIVRRKYPFKVVTESLPGLTKDTYRMVTNVSHELEERSRNGKFSSHVHNRQVSGGWMEVKDHSVLSGGAFTNQSYVSQDEFGCFGWNVGAINGKLVEDTKKFSCQSVM